MKNNLSQALSKFSLIEQGLIILFFMTAFNSIWCSILASFSVGSGHYNFITKDLFADYFKVIMSYPMLDLWGIENYKKFPALLKFYFMNNQYRSESLTHFHLPPLTTLFNLINIYLFKLINYKFIFALYIAITLLVTYSMTRFLNIEKSNYKKIFFLIILSYPFIFMIQRGNFISFFTFYLISISLILITKKKYILPIICFSLAINFRPNLVLLLPIIILIGAYPLRIFILTLLVSSLVFLGSLYLTNSIYPEYTFTKFIDGLMFYNKHYVLGTSGLSFSTSLFGLIKLLLIFFSVEILLTDFNLEKINYLITFSLIIVILITCYQFINKKINNLIFITLLITSVSLATPVFADYHLLIFFIPIMMVINETNKFKKINADYLCIFLVSIFMISPFNYFWVGVYITSQIKTIILILMIYKLLNNSFVNCK